MKTFKQFLAESSMVKVDVRKKKQVHKSTVAAGKAPRLELGVLGISIGQEQSTGPTSRVNEAQMQTLIKGVLRRSGTLQSVLGDDAEKAAELLNGKATDPAYVARLSDKLAPAAKAALTALIGKQSKNLHLVRLIGARKIIAVNDMIITNDIHFRNLVESVEDFAKSKAKLGDRVEFTSYKEWKKALPKNATFHGHENETAQAIGKDFEGVAGRFIHDKGTGWIYAYYLKPENLL